MSNHTRTSVSEMNAHRSQPDEVGFGSLLKALWSARGFILIPALLAGLLAFALFSVMAPEYSSEAQILVENRENAFTRPVENGQVNIGDSQALLDQAAVRSQVQLIQSRDVALAVAEKLKLAELEEFDPLVSGQSVISQLLVTIGFKSDPTRMTAEERVIEAVSDGLDVSAIEESRVISIRFTSEDPDLAADVVNAIVDEYLIAQSNAKQESTREATQWLASQIDDLRQSVVDAEERVAKFRAESGLLMGLNDQTLNSQQLSELNSQLILAQAQRSEAQARSQQILALLRSGGEIDGASDVVQSELIGRLQERLINLRADRAEQLSTLLPQHPRIKEVDAEISGLRSQIRNEMQRIVRSLQSEADVAGAREASIRANLEALKSRVSGTSREEVELRSLEREATAQRDLLEALLSRFREASARQSPDATRADARVISRPSVSNAPAAPERGIVMFAVTLITAFVMAGLVLARQLMRISAASIPNYALYPGPETVRHEPHLAGTASQDEAPPSPVLVKKEPSILERLDNFGTVITSGDEIKSLLLAGQNIGRKTIMVSAVHTYDVAVPVGLALARSLSMSGKKTLLIDAALDVAHEGDEGGGFGALLRGTSNFSDVIEKDPGSRVHVISRGNNRDHPLETLGSGRYHMIFSALTETYDFIIIATPPVMNRSEATLMASSPDQTVLLAVDKMDANQAGAARDRLAGAGASDVIAYIPGTPGSPGASRARDVRAA